MESTDFDVIVVGGGMVGCTLGVALASAAIDQVHPLRVCVLENRLPESFAPGSDPLYDLRVSALSIASQRILQKLDAWQGIIDRRACVYKRLSVWDGEQSGRTDFDCADIHASHLGHIVENRVLQLSLLDRAQNLEQLTLLCPARLKSYRLTADGINVSLDDGQSLNAKLLVGADGGNSIVRSQAGIELDKKSYEQHALVASVTTQSEQQDITWQRFVPTGPQAFLPLCGSRGSLVWYHDEENVKRLLESEEGAFMSELHASFPDELGVVNSVQARGSFPIAKAHAQSYIADRVALVGDAAHTVHPLAGQGVNLGLLDAAALAEVVLRASGSGRDFGQPSVLRRYQRMRYSDNQIMITALDSIHEMFKPRSDAVQRARSASLSLVNTVSPLRNLLMRHAMGVSGDLPELAS